MSQKELDIPTVKASQLNYRKDVFVHPSYRMTRVLPLSGSTIQTVNTTGGQETIFEIPVNAVNFAKSYLTFSFQIPPQTADNTAIRNYCFMDCFPHFRQLQLYTRSGIFICDLNEVANYTKVIWNAETKIENFLNNGLMVGINNAGAASTRTAGAIGAGAHFNRNNGAVLSIPAARLLGDTTTAASSADVSYTEPRYVFQSVVGGDVAGLPSILNFNVNIPFSMFKNTILSLDKDIYFGEIIILRAVWSPSVKIGFYNSGSATDFTNLAAALATNVSVSNINLYVAVEKNPELVNGLRALIASGGHNVLIPYVYTFKNSLPASTSQNVSLRFNRAHGSRLLKIYHTLFNGTESSVTAYDHNNINGVKCASYYTMLNNERLQEFNVDTTSLDDWNLQKDSLKGSVLQTSNMFQYNWFHRDRWDGLSLKDEESQSNLETGLDLSVEQKWDIYCTTATATAYNHYDFAVTQKMLTISSAGITVI